MMATSGGTRSKGGGKDGAHYLHERPPLEALVSPVVEKPTALTWADREDLLVLVGRDGVVTGFDPAFGIRELGPALPGVVRVVVEDGRFAVVDKDGHLEVRGWPDMRLRFQAETGFLGGVHLVSWSGGVAVAGDDGEARRIRVYDDRGASVGTVRVPARTALGVDAKGALLLARSTAEGVLRTPLGRPLSAAPPTAHTLRMTREGAVVGIASHGVTVWRPGDAPVTVRAVDVTAAALSRDGETLVMGTRIGRVALSSARVGAPLRQNPARVEGHEGPVIAVEFSPRGRWVATCAERCWVWSY